MYTLKKKNKLKRVSFNRSFKEGNRLFLKKNAVIIICQNKMNIARLGVVISKKNTKKAVLRNRQKRHVREWFRKKKSFFTGLDVVVLLKGKFETEVIKNEAKIISFAKKMGENN